LAVAAGCVFLLLLALVVFSVQSTGDYMVGAPVGGDNAAPGIQSLLHGSLRGYVSHQPIIGLTSILLRLPAAELASAFGAGTLARYQVGALACLVPLALGGAWLVTERGLSHTERLFRLMAVVIVIESPILYKAIEAGHPEEVLAQVLATGAVVAAVRRRPLWAAVLLGSALAAKETAVIAVAPVLIALPHRRREVCLLAGGLTILLAGIVWAADPAAFMHALHGEGATTFITPLSLTWPVSPPLRLVDGQASIAHVMPFGLTRFSLTLLTVAGVAGLAAAWYLRGRRRGRATLHPLALLALLGVLRCVCDSTHELYYYVSALVPLAGWEAFESRLPLATALVSLTVPLLFTEMGHVPAYSLYLASTAGGLVLVVFLGGRAVTGDNGAVGYEPDEPTVGVIGASDLHSSLVLSDQQR
jgi:hypothetical protein